MLLDYICGAISNLSNDPEYKFDFAGVRMDWARLQGYISSISGIRMAKMDEFKTSRAAEILNGIVFHTRVVDELESVLTETSDLSMFYFYSMFFETSFGSCLKFNDQIRHSIVFPLICTHFINITNEEFCPEEGPIIREKSLQLINQFLDSMAKETKTVVTNLCEGQAQLANKLLPTSSIAQVKCCKVMEHNLHQTVLTLNF